MTATTTAFAPLPTTTTASPATPTPQEQASALLAQVAGHVGVRTIEIGLRQGLLAALADTPDGLTTAELAAMLDLDPFYTRVWARAAVAAGVLDHADDGRLTPAPHMATLLLDTDAPAYVAGVFTVMTMPEIADWFAERMPTGERIWWDDTSHDFIRAVSGTGRPFYTRLIPDGLDHVPGVTGTLRSGGTVLDTACGAGVGLVRLAQHFPDARVTGADGDAYSLELAGQRIADAGLSDRVDLIHTPLEDLAIDGTFDLVINNISMHECRDIDAVTANIRRALRPGGWFVISDFPFPDSTEELRSVPGRIMSGIQFYEAMIDDQLVPVDVYVELLGRHDFDDVDTVSLTPVHALAFGRR